MNETLKKNIDKFRNFNILYAEDEKLIRETSLQVFNHIFNSTDTVSNGEEALELYKKNKYDIVLTDITMPVLDGIELLKAIKQIDDTQIVIGLTSHNKYDYEEIELFDEVAYKPFNINDISIVISKALKF